MEYENIQIVVVDLEATGLDEEDEIIQIAACTRYSLFNVYITPTRPVCSKASEITGMQMYDGYLYLNNEMVYSKPPAHAFVEFLDYLRSLNSRIILVAHNGFKFDMPKILKLAQELGYLEEFESMVYGFSDSLKMFRSLLKDRLKERKGFSMQQLVEDYLGDASGLHNATCDVQMLMSLLDLHGVTDEYIVKNTLTIHNHFYFEAIDSLQYYYKVLPAPMLGRLAENRINRKFLRDVFYTTGYDGIYSLFTEDLYGNPRITEDTSLIDAMCNALYNELYVANTIHCLI